MFTEEKNGRFGQYERWPTNKFNEINFLYFNLYFD